MARERAAAGALPWWRQCLEMVRLALRNGIGPGLYMKAGLYRRDLSWRDKTDFIGSHRFPALDAINPTEYRPLAEKYASAALFEAFNIPTPETYAVLAADRGVSFDGRCVRTPGDLEALICERSLTAVCFKPVAGHSGRGFAKVEIERGRDGEALRYLRLPGRETVDVETLWNRELGLDAGVPYLCQQTVDQHPLLAELHPGSLNTARIWMGQERAGDWRMAVALLRMGCGGAVMDNISQGGLGAPIDMESGVLGDGIYQDALDWRCHAEHPTTRAVIRGRVLPMWSEFPAFCRLVCLPYTPYLRLLGLDIAFGRDGLLAIEVNVIPNIGDQCTVGFGFRPFLDRLLAEGRD